MNGQRLRLREPSLASTVGAGRQPDPAGLVFPGGQVSAPAVPTRRPPTPKRAVVRRLIRKLQGHGDD
jgi:hypothetical protein